MNAVRPIPAQYVSWDASGNLTLASAASVVLKSGAITTVTLDASNNATFAGSITAASAITVGSNQYLLWSGKGGMNRPSDGVQTLVNNAGTDFGRLQFGGTTNAYAAISRLGAGLGVVLADNSAYAAFTVGNAVIKNAAGNGGAGEVVLGNSTQTTVGAAGGASALPATPSGFLKFKIGSTEFVMPYYPAA